MKRAKILIFTLSIFCFSSCSFPEDYFTAPPECKSESSDDLEQINQNILIVKLKDQEPEDYRYFFKTFKEEKGNSYMITNFRNEKSCFDLKILVDKWDKLAGMKRTNGVSYPNELYDLKWEIISINGEKVAKYIDMHHIID